MIKLDAFIITQNNKPARFQDQEYAVFFDEQEAIDFCDKCFNSKKQKIYDYKPCECEIKL